MLTSCIVRIVDLSRKYSVLVLLVALAASIAMGSYVMSHIKINTDINQLLAADLDWRKREVEMEKAFPQKTDRLVIVVDGANADLAEIAAAKLSEKISSLPEMFKNVTRPESIPFFKKNGLLFLSEKELNDVLETLVQAQPLLGTLANDPSLRGLFGTLGLVIEGLKRGDIEYKQMDMPFTKMAETLESITAGDNNTLPWRSLMSDQDPKLRDLRKFILTQPTLDYSSLSPGEAASNAVRAMAKEMELTPDHGINVRLTGSVALNDEEFASITKGAETATLLSVALVVALLFMALKSFRLIIPIVITLFAGLIATTAFAMAAIGSLNLISIAFAVMFVGIAVDFGIQFGVRYRDQHHVEPDSAKAMLLTARIIAAPLTLAAASTIIGFLAFIPTDYKGVSELGLIAGVGMIIAYIFNITLLPALLSIFKPPAEFEAVGYAWTAPIDGFLIKHRKPLLVLITILTIIALGTASQIRFDFDPLNLKDPKSESVSTMFDIMEDPQATPYVIEILKPSIEEAKAVESKLSSLPEVSHTMTLASFVPDDQDKKLSMISDVNFLLAPTLNPSEVMAPPNDDEIFEALSKASGALREIGGEHETALRLSKALDDVVSNHSHDLLLRLHTAIISGMETQLTTIRDSLSAEQITIDNITEDLRRDWITADGRAKIEVYPKGNARDHKILTALTSAVLQIEPEATGSPISIQESGKTVSSAFIKAGLLALLAIGFLFWLILKTVADVLRLLAPLIIAGIFTLATMVTIHLPLNFANIIALPLLLSLGVSYSIYFVSYWRSGTMNPLQSSMARAVLFSAATTLVAFGSLSISTHQGTSGMGELLTIALLYSLLCTFLVLPVLLGKPK